MCLNDALILFDGVDGVVWYDVMVTVTNAIVPLCLAIKIHGLP